MSMKLDTSDFYPWNDGRKRPAENLSAENSALEDAELNPAEAAPSSVNSAAIPAERPPVIPTEENTRPLSDIAPETASEETPRAPAGVLTMLSHFLSWVLSPVITPTLGIIAVFYLSMYSYAPRGAKLLIAGIVFTFTCVIPCAAIWILTRFGDVSDMALTRRSDRLFPYIITGACLFGCGWYLMRTGLPEWVGYFYIGASVATLVNLLINFKWKISAHGAGIGGLIAMLIILNRYGLPAYNLWGWVLAAVIAAGLLGAARVWLWRHTPMQTICGEIVGFLGVMATELMMNH